MASFLVPDDFREFMRSVVAYLDAPGDNKLLDAEDALQHDCGRGGRIDGATAYRFSYLTLDGSHRWTILVDEHEIRAISDGLQIEAEGERFDLVRTQHRQPTGDPLVIWGAYNDDALTVRSLDDLAFALDVLRLYARDQPRILRLWSSRDDQLVAAVWRDECALYVIEAVDGYATSTGDPQRTDSFEVIVHDGNSLIVPWSDCVAWPAACAALLRFAIHGDLGPEVRVEGRIPSQLLMLGELDRRTMLAMRAEPAHDPRHSSLRRMIASQASDFAETTHVVDPAFVATGRPVLAAPRSQLGSVALAAWADRMLQVLFTRGLLELGHAARVEEVSYQLSGLLQAHGDEAEHSLDTADWLVNEITSIRGVARLFATGGDLQLALRRSRPAV